MKVEFGGPWIRKRTTLLVLGVLGFGLHTATGAPRISRHPCPVAWDGDRIIASTVQTLNVPKLSVYVTISQPDACCKSLTDLISLNGTASSQIRDELSMNCQIDPRVAAAIAPDQDPAGTTLDGFRKNYRSFECRIGPTSSDASVKAAWVTLLSHSVITQEELKSFERVIVSASKNALHEIQPIGSELFHISRPPNAPAPTGDAAMDDTNEKDVARATSIEVTSRFLVAGFEESLNHRLGVRTHVVTSAAYDLGLIHTSHARTLGQNRMAFMLVESSQLFDTDDGRKIDPEHRVDARLTWLAGAYGLTDRLDLQVMVPFSSIDVPEEHQSYDTTLSRGRYSGVGDIGASAQLQLFPPRDNDHKRTGDGNRSSPAGHASSPLRPQFELALRGGVRTPTSDGKEGLGVDQWTEQLGIVSDLVAPRQLGRLVPFLAGWIWHRQANGGWGASAGADFVLREAVTFTAGATGTYGEHMMGKTADYLDGYLEVRIGSSRRDRDRYAGRRVEGSLKFQVALNDDGTRASKALFAGLKVIL